LIDCLIDFDRTGVLPGAVGYSLI